jgi:alanine-glyoxylate transaminase / serine-glyoxylate transaminase / serine-pyruvate transaminase
MLTIPEILLLGPGPSNPYPEVLQAIAQPTLGHLDPAFIAIMDEIQHLLQYAYQTDSPYTYVVSGPGSLGMETCFVNLVEPGDKMLVCRNGFFSNRMYENARRYGADIISVEAPWGQAINVQQVADALQNNPGIRIVTVVQAETSTGVINDVQAIAALARKHDCLVIVDTVTSLGANALYVKNWQIDAVYSCSQKGLGSVPGMSPVTFSEAAFQKVKERKTPVASWFQDITSLHSYWSGEVRRPYHHTAPANQYYALLAALRRLKNNSLETTWQQHTDTHQYFAKQVEALGLQFFVAPEHRLPQLNTVLLPEGADDAALRSKIRQEYKIEVGAGLGEMAGKLWRIGLMGANANREAADKLVQVLKAVL